jgi:hypothetical protein
MSISDIPRTVVESYLRLIRVPLDAAIERLPGNGTGAAPSAMLAVDRADASVRAVLASLLRDPGLREDARQRRTAAEKREEAMRLREAAERTSEDADARLSRREAQAERQREQAERHAKARRNEADQQRQAKAKRAAQAERKRQEANHKAAAASKKAVEKRATKKQLDALETKAEVLGEKDRALTASDEARRLRDAASQTKAQRKNNRS